MKKKHIEHDHSTDSIAARLALGGRQSYVRDWIFGGIDGVVTTFAIISGVVGANLSVRVIVVLGLANIVADGFSMAASNFLGTKAEKDEVKHLEAVEHRHIDETPHGEKEEVRQIFEKKGFGGEDLERAVETITADRQRWVQTMLSEEYGLPLSVRTPWIAGLVTFSAFVVCGLLPLMPFLMGAEDAFVWGVWVAGATFFVIGSVKSRWSISPWWLSGILTLGLGAVASAMAFGVGWLFRQYGS